MKQVIVLGGAFISFVMGSGFASGQEILQFFTTYGLSGGFGACLISLFIFTWVGSTVQADARKLGPVSSMDVYKVYCGNTIGSIFELIIPVIMFLFFTVMISGAGATFEESFGIDAFIGRIIMCLICIITVLTGFSGLVRIIFPIGITILAFSILISLINISFNLEKLFIADMLLNQLPVPRAKFIFTWWQSGILYGTFNMVTALPFLSGLGKQADKDCQAFGAGIFGGVSYIAGAALINLTLLANIALVYNKQIPFLWIANDIFPVVGDFFSLILLGGIFTTAVPMLWSISNLVCTNILGVNNYKISLILISGAAYICGGLPFDKLVGTIYPLTGIIGVLLLICMVHKKYIYPFISNK